MAATSDVHTLRNMSSTVSRAAGYVTGAVLSPVTAAASFLRHARVFHPRGIVLRGSARSVAAHGPLRELGSHLEGQVIVRFSSGWWKRREWPDVLGCAIRFTDTPEFSPEPREADQDLLLATIKHPLTTLLAPLTTRVSDFLSNDYFGVSPFAAAKLPHLYIRLRPLRPGAADESTRADKLSKALARGPISLHLQVRTHRFFGEFRDVVVIDLTEEIQIDQSNFSFDPFQNGRGLKPDSFIHSVRAASYAASRSGRHAGAAPPS
jgi:hypothetical protein